tara:strand:+ start:4681 stop:5604 length:924 start_codon:yes stop_codon:yes gene_type:complete
MTNIPENLQNATIVIVGASSGFGKGVAFKLAKEGANVVVAARRLDLLDELVRDIKAEGGNALAVQTDVSEQEGIRNLAQKSVDAFGRIDVWINNVGVGALGYFWEIPLDVHERVVDVNLSGLIYGAHTALNQFIKQKGGTLVNVGSIDSEVPLALQNTYAATKAAVLSLSRSLNEELRLSGNDEHIHVATIMPWAVDTPWWTHAANYTGQAPRMAAMDDPDLVVDAIVKACTNPREEMPVGIKAHASNIFHQIFPDLTERMSASLAKRESNKAVSAPHTQGTLFEPMEEGRGIDGGIRARMKKEDTA